MQKNKIEITQKSTSIDSVVRASDILICLNDGVNTTTEISRYLKLNKSRVYRLLRTLEEVGFVTQDRVTRRYHLGRVFLKLALDSQVIHNDLIMSATDEMKHLSEISWEPVALDIMIGNQSIRLMEIPSLHGLRVTQDTKAPGSIYAGSAGKALLSQLSDNNVETHLKSINLKPITANTITDKEDLRAELKKIRQQGYAISYGEKIEGAIGISVPISNYVYPSSLSVYGPEYRLKPRERYLVKELKKSASLISKNISATIYLGR